MLDFSPLKAVGTVRHIEAPADSPLASYLDHYRLAALLQADDDIRLHAGFLQAEGEGGRTFELWTQVWAPPAPRGTIFVVHGYFDHLGLYGHLLERLLAQNWQVVMWDLPGHGLSSGARATIDDFTDYVKCFNHIERQIADLSLAPGPWLAIGQSTGASIVATDALARGEQAPWQGLVLLAPLVRPWGWNQSRWLHRIASPFVDTIPRKYRANTTNLDFADFLRLHDPLQDDHLALTWVTAMRRWMPTLLKRPPSGLPVLILQGEQDLTVDWSWNLKALRRKFPQAQVVRHPEARHHLVNEAEPIRRVLFAALDDFLTRFAATHPPTPLTKPVP
ncbi:MULTISPECIES: alpha/beta hydrolase [Salinicola]|jgi:alpha-beta hydrolase superfamily lysophospholipase|uniref:alpha/beta hydrolase n=1 Tax=Salinicola salarius TaxID=430457 RepID=UPI0026F205F8|nr:alpha/beta hydrolase [Salinicola salarius]